MTYRCHSYWPVGHLSGDQTDRRWLFAAKRATGSDLEYDHLRAHEECLLWIADAVAWCWTAKGPWREHIRKIGVVEVTNL